MTAPDLQTQTRAAVAASRVKRGPSTESVHAGTVRPNGLANSHTIFSTPYRHREDRRWPLKRFSTTRWPCFSGAAA